MHIKENGNLTFADLYGLQLYIHQKTTNNQKRLIFKYLSPKAQRLILENKNNERRKVS